MSERLRKHIDNTDVAIEVLKLFYIREKDAYSVKVAWWNIGPHAAYPMNITQRFRVTRENWARWRVYEPKRVEFTP